MPFIVAGGTFASHCSPSMVDFDVICGARCLTLMLCVIAGSSFGSHCFLLRCLISMLLVVAGGTFGSHCFLSMYDFDAGCYDRRFFWKLLLYLILFFFFILMLFGVTGDTFGSH